MKFLGLILFNLALTSFSFILIENRIPVYKVVQHENFKIDFGRDIQGLKVCNISKSNHDNNERCTYISQHKMFYGYCPRFRFTGNESRCHCYKTLFFVNDKQTKYARTFVLIKPFKQGPRHSA